MANLNATFSALIMAFTMAKCHVYDAQWWLVIVG